MFSPIYSPCLKNPSRNSLILALPNLNMNKQENTDEKNVMWYNRPNPNSLFSKVRKSFVFLILASTLTLRGTIPAGIF